MQDRSRVETRVSRVMQSNRGRDTRPEKALRRVVHRAGLRYRVDVRPEPNFNRRADIVFRPQKIAVYVHGCFWHGCKKHFSPPKTNKEFWSDKISRNRQRDLGTRAMLKSKGWKVLEFWEHDNIDESANIIIQEVKGKKLRNRDSSLR